MTCNPTWKEIKDNLYPGQTPSDRPDLIARVFCLKQKILLEMVTRKDIFGKCDGDSWNDEFQKRLLPHSHNLFWIKDFFLTPERIDMVISAEIPDPVQDPELFEIVTKNMIHGPCGITNPSAPCMVNGVCSKGFPKAFQTTTLVGEGSYPLYKRRSPSQGGRTVEKICFRDGIRTVITVDNSWIVPYSPFLSRQMNCHINVEICSSVSSIKYILKYTHKGTDRAVYNLEDRDIDEISEYHNHRYSSFYYQTARHLIKIISLDLHHLFL